MNKDCVAFTVPETLQTELDVEVTLRLTDIRPVCLAVRRPSGTATNFSFALKFPSESCGFVIL
jgi:hypothetical protein